MTVVEITHKEHIKDETLEGLGKLLRQIIPQQLPCTNPSGIEVHDQVLIRYFLVSTNSQISDIFIEIRAVQTPETYGNKVEIGRSIGHAIGNYLNPGIRGTIQFELTDGSYHVF